MNRIRTLAADELRRPELRELLRLAAELDDEALARISREELPTLDVLGAEDDEGRSIGFVAFDASGDPVGFYRRLGFAIAPGEPDPRWPDRARYECRLVSS